MSRGGFLTSSRPYALTLKVTACQVLRSAQSAAGCRRVESSHRSGQYLHDPETRRCECQGCPDSMLLVRRGPPLLLCMHVWTPRLLTSASACLLECYRVPGQNGLLADSPGSSLGSMLGINTGMALTTGSRAPLTSTMPVSVSEKSLKCAFRSGRLGFA